MSDDVKKIIKVQFENGRRVSFDPVSFGFIAGLMRDVNVRPGTPEPYAKAIQELKRQTDEIFLKAIPGGPVN